MGRPREFDEDEVLDHALQAFWRHGYEATSVADLMEATGLAKGSLYKAFGDKRSLMLQALRRYLDQGFAFAQDQLAADEAPFALLRSWLETLAQRSTGEARDGCFAVNCTVETAPHDPEIKAVLAAHRQRVASLYAELFQRAAESGTLRPGVEPEVAASLLTTLVNGLMVSGRGGLPEQDAHRQLDLFLDSLRAPTD